MQLNVRKMYTRIASQIFTWAGLEPLILEYDARRFVIPGRNETAKPGPGEVWTHESARDAKGNMIPGTIVVQDGHVDAGGQMKTVFRVSDMCEWLASGREDLFARGFNIVGTVQEVAEAIEIGIPLWEQSQDARAREIIATELTRRKNFEDKGQPAPASSSQHLVDWAISHLASRQQQQKPLVETSVLMSALKGQFSTPVAPKPEPAAPVPEARATKMVPDRASEIYQECEDLGIRLTREELAGLLRGDPDQTGYVMEKLKIKREALAQEAAPGA